MTQLLLDLEIMMTPEDAADRCGDEWGRPQQDYWCANRMLAMAFQDAIEEGVKLGLIEIRHVHRLRHHPTGEVRDLVEGVDVFPKYRLEHPPKTAGWYGGQGWAEWRRTPEVQTA